MPIRLSCVYYQNFYYILAYYDILSVLSYRYPTTGGGVHMEIITAFLVTVAAGVACHYIIKWLDSDHKDNE